jgi:hypothetical protein
MIAFLFAIVIAITVTCALATIGHFAGVVDMYREIKTSKI